MTALKHANLSMGLYGWEEGKQKCNLGKGAGQVGCQAHHCAASLYLQQLISANVKQQQPE